jgi:hypothetical protein
MKIMKVPAKNSYVKHIDSKGQYLNKTIQNIEGLGKQIKHPHEKKLLSKARKFHESYLNNGN